MPFSRYATHTDNVSCLPVYHNKVNKHFVIKHIVLGRQHKRMGVSSFNIVRLFWIILLIVLSVHRVYVCVCVRVCYYVCLFESVCVCVGGGSAHICVYVSRSVSECWRQTVVRWWISVRLGLCASVCECARA